MPFPKENLVYDYRLDDGGVTKKKSADEDEDDDEKKTTKEVTMELMEGLMTALLRNRTMIPLYHKNTISYLKLFIYLLYALA